MIHTLTLQVKCSIREVHEALEERFLERLETWRVECETSGGAQGLGSATGVEPMVCKLTRRTLQHIGHISPHTD